MEDDKKSSMSDKDRKMAGLFEGFGHKKEDDEEKKGKKSSKIPKRSLFLGNEAVTPKAETTAKAETDSGEKKNLFSGLFKDKEIAVVETEPKNEDVKAEFSEVVVDRLQEVEKELEATTSSEDALEVTADAEFLEQVGSRLSEGLEPETAIDDALEDVYQPPDVDARPLDLDTPENFDEQPEEEPYDPIVPTRLTTPTIPVPSTAVYNPNIAPPQPLTPNVARSPNVVPMNDTFYRERSSGDLLIGGTLGYLMGKRRGRNSAEGRLEPEINKLDKKVEGLKQKLEESERLVREEISKSEQPERAPNTLETTTEKPKAVDKAELDIENIAPASLETEQKIVESQERQFEAQLQAMADLEIATLEAPKVENGPVRVGEVLELKSKNKEIDTPEVHKDVRSMTMPDLLAVAEHITLEKTTLRELYERNRIDAVNLRRVIIEYMNGGRRYEQLLHRSLEAVEMQRELRGEIKKETDFSSSGVLSNAEGQTTATTNLNQTNSYQATNSNPNGSQANPQANNKVENEVLTGSNAVMLGIIVGIIIAIAFVISSF